RVYLEIVTPGVVPRRREVRRRVVLAADIVGVSLDVAVAVAQPGRTATLLDDPAGHVQAPATVLLRLAPFRVRRAGVVVLHRELVQGEHDRVHEFILRRLVRVIVVAAAAAAGRPPRPLWRLQGV